MTLIYQRTLLPKFLKRTYKQDDPDTTHVKWEAGIEANDGNDLQLRVKADSQKWERVFQMQLVDEDVIRSRDDVTIKMKIGVILPEPQQPRDPMSYMISDGTYAIGFQIMDPNHDYAKSGPYQAVEGAPNATLSNPNVIKDYNIVTNSRRNPDVFDVIIKPKYRWGTVYCAIDDGHKIVAQFGRELDLSKGLYLETYRYEANEVYTVNYIDISVYIDNQDMLKQ